MKFTNLGLNLLTNINVRHLSNQANDAEDIWNKDMNSLHDQILSQKTEEEQIHIVECFLLRKRKPLLNDYRIKHLNHIIQVITHQNVFSLTHLRDKNHITKKHLNDIF